MAPPAWLPFTGRGLTPEVSQSAVRRQYLQTKESGRELAFAGGKGRNSSRNPYCQPP